MSRIQKLEKMSLEDKAEFIIAVRNYRCENRKRRFDGFDFSVLDANSTEKILVRSIEPQTKAGFVGVDDVKKMAKEMKNQNFDRGVFISKRFTVAAEEEMALRKIQQVSDVYMPPVKTEDLYLTIGDCADRQCRAKCGNVPARKSECQSLADGTPCRVRTISNNAIFHLEHGWLNLLNEDLMQLLSLPKSSRNTRTSVGTSVGHSLAAEV